MNIVKQQRFKRKPKSRTKSHQNHHQDPIRESIPPKCFPTAPVYHHSIHRKYSKLTFPLLCFVSRKRKCELRMTPKIQMTPLAALIDLVSINNKNCERDFRFVCFLARKPKCELRMTSKSKMTSLAALVDLVSINNKNCERDFRFVCFLARKPKCELRMTPKFPSNPSGCSRRPSVN